MLLSSRKHRYSLSCVLVLALLMLSTPVIASADTAAVPMGPAQWKAASSLMSPRSASIAAIVPLEDSSNDIGGATGMPLLGSFSETLDFVSDPADVFTLTIPDGQRLFITLTADPDLLLADAYLLDQWATSIDVDQAVAGTSTDDAVEVFTFDNTTGAPVPYYLAVVAMRGSGTYTIEWGTFEIPSHVDDEIPGVATSLPASGSDTVHPLFDRDDVYAVDLAVGERLLVDVSDDESLDVDVYVYAPGSTALGTDVALWGSATGGDETFYIDVRTGMAGTYYVDIRARSGSGAYTYSLSKTPTPVGAWESIGALAPIASVEGTITDSLDPVNDVNDAWYMDLTAGERVIAGLEGAAGTDFDLYVYGPGTTDLATAVPVVYSNNLDSGEEVVLDVVTAGRYYFEVRSFSGSGSYTFTWLRTATPVPADVVRLEGPTRYQTAIELSQSVFADGSADTVILATGENYPDALSASALAGVHDCPLLLTPKDYLVAGLLDELDRLGADEVIIVGSDKAVSLAAEQTIKDSGRTTRRISGATRYSTATAIAEEVIAMQGGAWAGTAFVVRADHFADALAAAPLAFRQGFPVLLTSTTALSAETRTFMVANDVSDVIITGSVSAVSAGVESAIKAVPGVLNVERLEGPTRYETAAAIAAYGVRHEWTSAAYVGVATGLNFPDALGGGVVCGRNGGVLLLTHPDTLSAPVADFIDAHSGDVMRVEVFGAPSAVKSAVFDALSSLVP